MTKITIMVVEDERIVGRDIQSMLQREGYHVPPVVPTGALAVTRAAELRPDLVLMDVVLGKGIDGIEAARQIHLQQDVPIVYLTANGDRAILDRSKETDPVAFIRKPYDEQEVLTTIEVSLHQYRAHKSRAHAALQSSEARFQELFESARDGIAITDLAGHHLKCNPAYLGLLGYGRFADLPSCALADLTTPEFRQFENEIIRDQTLRRGYSDEYEKALLRKDGSRVNVSSRAWLRRDDRGTPVGLWLMARDITDRKESERRVLEYQQQLRSMMDALSFAEERERQRIAADIHDRISQTLAVCQLRLGTIARSEVSPEVAREAKKLSRLLDQTIQDTSTLIFELSPPVLHQLGLAPALEWFGEKIQQQYGLRVWIQGECGQNVLAGEPRTTIFRAVCELINNAAKHGHATTIRTVLAHQPGTLEIEVKDNGVGFNPDEVTSRKPGRGGFGLFHIRERLRGLGGVMELISKPGAGTRVRLTVPATAAPPATKPS